MDKKYLNAVVGGLVILAVGAALWVSTRPAAPTVAPTATVRTGNDSANSGAKPSQTGNDSAGTTVAAPTPAVQAAPGAGNAKETVDPSLAEEDLLDDDTVARLLERFGSYGELYKALTPAQREELIDWLQSEEKLRENLAEILPVERDSDLRAYLLRRVEPQGFWEGDENSEDEDFVDTEMIALLDRPTDTPIKPEEWMARTDLAVITDMEYALTWTREAKRAHPEDLQVGMQAASMTMIIGASVDGVSKSEAQGAEEYLRSALAGEQAASLSSDEKVKAYHALYWAEDKEGARDWFRTQLAAEQDPRARQTLENLLARIERRLAGTQ